MIAALLRERPDVVLLQETHVKSFDPASPYILKSRWFPHQYAAFGTSKARGVAILIAKDLQFTFSDSLVDLKGRYLFVNCVINEMPFTLASIYAPNTDQLPFLTDTFMKLHGFKSGEVLLGGDLNYISDLTSDKLTVQSPPSNKRRTAHRPMRFTAPTKLPELFQSFGLVDVWRTLYPSSRQFTYFSSSHCTYTRIDFILVSNALFSTVFSAGLVLVPSQTTPGLAVCLLVRLLMANHRTGL